MPMPDLYAEAAYHVCTAISTSSTHSHACALMLLLVMTMQWLCTTPVIMRSDITSCHDRAMALHNPSQHALSGRGSPDVALAVQS